MIVNTARSQDVLFGQQTEHPVARVVGDFWNRQTMGDGMLPSTKLPWEDFKMQKTMRCIGSGVEKWVITIKALNTVCGLSNTFNISFTQSSDSNSFYRPFERPGQVQVCTSWFCWSVQNVSLWNLCSVFFTFLCNLFNLANACNCRAANASSCPYSHFCLKERTSNYYHSFIHSFIGEKKCPVLYVNQSVLLYQWIFQYTLFKS